MGMLLAWAHASMRDEAASAGAAEHGVVIDTLLEWYEVQEAYRPMLGYSRKAREAAGFRISRQWLDESELDDDADTQIRAQRASEVERCVDQLDARFRAAIQTEMRNCLAGATVFSSVRNAGSHDADFRTALALLKPIFAARGLLD